ncbi:MAG: clan AA aspartic protease [Chthoniobacterales bacterium]|nr:clan AA aspartic protease [Chthoniobacterales bacterium]
MSSVGEVRTKVKLSNPYDELRARHGEIPAAQVRTYEADAMIDSGAVRTIIPVAVFDRLGLETQRTAVAEYADGRKDAVRLTDGLRIEILGRDTFDEALVLGDEVLIGQTVLEKLDLWIDCHNRRLIPNPAHPDQPVSKVK